MPRQEPPENPDFYFEPTRAAHYQSQGGYGDPYTSAPLPPIPWFRRPPALVAAGALAVVVLAGLAIGAMTLMSHSAPSSGTTTSSSAVPAPSTTTAAPATHRARSGGTTVVTEAPPVATDTVTAPATDTATDTPTPTTTAAPTTDTSTVTQTVTVPPTREPFFPRHQGQ